MASRRNRQFFAGNDTVVSPPAHPYGPLALRTLQRGMAFKMERDSMVWATSLVSTRFGLIPFLGGRESTTSGGPQTANIFNPQAAGSCEPQQPGRERESNINFLATL